MHFLRSDETYEMEADMETIEVIRNILAENLDIDPALVTEESTFDSLNIDSLDMVELICSLEDTLDIDFGEPEGLMNVGDVIMHIESL